MIPNRLIAYADEQIAPGGNREAYVLYWSATHDWYFKAGQMYLLFGLRLQDQTALIYTATGHSAGQFRARAAVLHRVAWILLIAAS